MLEGLSPIILLAVVLAFIAYGANRIQKQKKKPDVKPTVPGWFDWKKYIELNPDVKSVATTKEAAWSHYDAYGRVEKRPPYNGVDGSPAPAPVPTPPPPPPPPKQQPPFGNWCYIDDVPFHGGAHGVYGDPNGAQDLACVLAIALAQNSLPRFIGVTCTGGGTSKELAEKIVKASGLDIPVIEGQNSYDYRHDSALSREIVKWSKKGKFTICSGGPVETIAHALNNGAHKHNLQIHALLFGTWNEYSDSHARETERSRLTKESAAQIKKHAVKIRNIGEDRFKGWYHPKKFHAAGLPAPKYSNWVETYRGNVAGKAHLRTSTWWAACTGRIINRIVTMDQYEASVVGSLRIADHLAVLDYFGHDDWRNNPQISFDIIERGFRLQREFNAS